MANASVINEKAQIVNALAERMQKAQSGVLVDYSGLTVAQDTELRAELRKAGVEYSVVKNTMMHRALDQVGLQDLDPLLKGTVSLATGNDDPIVPIRMIADHSKKFGDKFNIKGAFVEGKILSDEEIQSMAALSSKKDLQAQVLGTLLGPIASLAAVLAAIVESKGGSGEEAPAEG